VDMGTGMWAVTAILAALRERDRTGRGAHVTTALYDTVLAWMTFPMGNYLASGEVPTPQGSGIQMIVPYQAFPSRDAWVMIGAGSDALFAKCFAALDVEALAADPRFLSNPARVASRAALFDSLAAVTRIPSTDDLPAPLPQAGSASHSIPTIHRADQQPTT